MELQEVKAALDDAGRLYKGQFEEINSKIKALEAKGAAVDPILLEVREKLNRAIEDASAKNDQFIAMQASMGRLEKMGLPGGPGDCRDFELEARAFNIERRSIAAAKGLSIDGDATVDEYRAYTKAFDRYLRVGEKGLTADEARAMSVGTDSAGGFLVSPDKSGQIVKKIFETSDVRRYASIQAISTDALEGMSDLDEASGGWVSELGTRSDSTTPAVQTPWRIPVHEQYSQPKASQKLVNDASISIADWLNGKVADKLSRLQNVAFVTGSGVGQPRGFANYTTSTTYAWGTPEHVATGSSGSWGTDPNGITKLNTLQGLLKDTYVPGAHFFMNRTTKFSIRNLTDASAAGKYVFIPSFVAGMPDMLLGAPIVVFQDMVSYSTASALAVAYGDMKRYYQIVDRQGISVLVDPYTSKPYVIFYTTARVGGDVIDFEAMKFLKFA
jgi:HK97 family phage major capsid protein